MRSIYFLLLLPVNLLALVFYALFTIGCVFPSLMLVRLAELMGGEISGRTTFNVDWFTAK